MAVGIDHKNLTIAFRKLSGTVLVLFKDDLKLKARGDPTLNSLLVKSNFKGDLSFIILEHININSAL